MPAVLMIEALTQVAAALILDRAAAPASARVSLRGVNDAKFRRNVFPGDRLDLRGHARADAARGWPRRMRGRQWTVSSSPRPSCCWPSSRAPPSSIRRAHVHPSARIGEGTDDRSARGRRRPTSRIGRNCRSARRSSSTAGPRSATRRRSTRWRRLASRRRISSIAASARGCAIGRAQHLPRVRDHQSRHGGRRRRDDDRRQQPVHGLRPRGARLPHRQRHDLRSARHARRPRRRRGLREHQRRVGGPSVLPRRPACVRRRLFGRDQGRAAVRADDRQPPGAHLRRQHDRPAPAAASRRTPSRSCGRPTAI